jgi:hypothetical protein
MSNERESAILFFLNTCANKYNNEKIKHIEFNYDDKGNENENRKQYSMCYNKNKPILKKYCGPDFSSHHWPSANISSFEETKKLIIIASKTDPTINKVGWFGNIHSPGTDVIEHHTRPLLKKIGDENPDLFDIFHINPINGIIDDKVTNYKSFETLTKYKYLIDIGGNGYSGRLKYLLFSQRPVLIVDRVYIEYFYEDLIPFVHFIPVKEDLSDLIVQVNWMKNNPEKSLDIANNAFEFAINTFSINKFIEKTFDVFQNVQE